MDLSLPEAVTAAGSIEEAADALGATLGLAGPVPLPAAARALKDPAYAKALMGSRKVPVLRDQLLAAGQSPSAPSAAQLAGKAAGSLLKWGMDGLKPAEPWVIERRLAACKSCEFRAPAPDTLIYRGAKVVVGADAEICASCHCLINTKAAISTEHCPEQDPENPERSRWGETWLPPQDHPKGPW